MGVPCFVGEPREAARTVVNRALSGSGGYVCLANSHVLVAAQHSRTVNASLGHAWLVLPDGAPVAWMQRRRGNRQARRIGGADLMSLVCAEGTAFGVRHFLLGASNGVLSSLQKSLEFANREISICGVYSPSRAEVESRDERVVSMVQEARPHIVWCAFGAPRQELWMADQASLLSPAIVIGVGAAFAFLSGAQSRAPEWMQTSGLEWVHRLAHEPRRLAWRYLRTNSEFAARALLSLSDKRR